MKWEKSYTKHILIILVLGIITAFICGFLAWWFIFDGLI